MPRMSQSSSRELSRSLATKTHCRSFIASLPFLVRPVYRSAMRTVWTMGFVAAAALSFCFPDFIVFRFTQATIWAIALVGLVLLCGVSGQFSFAQAALFGIGGYGAAIVGAHTPLSVYWGLPLALLTGFAAGYGLGRIAGGHSLWTQALMSYAFAIAFPQLLRWRVIEGWTGGVQVRATASGIAGAYLALAGCLSAYQFGFVGPTAYNFALSVQMLFGLVIGGMQSLGGAILGGLFLQFFPDVTAGLGKGLSALLYAVLLIAAIVAMPEGVAGALKRLFLLLSPARGRGWVRGKRTV